MNEQAVESFVQAARAYCSLVESRDETTRAVFVDECRKTLVRVYGCALQLPDVDPGGGDQNRSDAVGATWTDLNRSLGDLLGDWNAYREVFDPYDFEEPVSGRLSDDLADIYLDLKRGLRQYEGPGAQDKLRAVWDWRFHFAVHWGEHLTGALRPLHALLEMEWQ